MFSGSAQTHPLLLVLLLLKHIQLQWGSSARAACGGHGLGGSREFVEIRTQLKPYCS